MSRVASKPVSFPKGVDVVEKAGVLNVKGPKGELSMSLNSEVEISIADNEAMVSGRSGSHFAHAMTGTTRALLNNMVKGVTDGFEKKLELVGVG